MRILLGYRGLLPLPERVSALFQSCKTDSDSLSSCPLKHLKPGKDRKEIREVRIDLEPNCCRIC